MTITGRGKKGGLARETMRLADGYTQERRIPMECVGRFWTPGDVLVTRLRAKYPWERGKGEGQERGKKNTAGEARRQKVDDETGGQKDNLERLCVRRNVKQMFFGQGCRGRQSHGGD